MDLRRTAALVAIFGGFLVALGTAAIHLPAGVIVAGVLLLAAGVLALREER